MALEQLLELGRSCDPAGPGGTVTLMGVNALEAPAQVLPPLFSAWFHLLRIVLPASLLDFSWWAGLEGGTQCFFLLCCRLQRAALPGTQAVPASSKHTNSRQSQKTSSACFSNTSNLQEIQGLLLQHLRVASGSCCHRVSAQMAPAAAPTSALASLLL